ncbi:Alpha/Beta hydrolase protein [Leptodontidium sp. MPI-SDFR-AT-0119]|nr:Alpha/Beta hydrolase protein [Leptodontidium sp. MPI-SDFR-AT-0119]
MTTELKHPLLGNVIGLDHEKTISYRGIKYAELEHAFAEPILFTYPRRSKIDAASYGPLCAQNPESCDFEFSFIQHELPRDEFQFSLTDCLNLNIATPKETHQLLPVFVFIYGGGFSLGGNSWPQYDPTRLVELSIKERSPIIGININYRVGLPGFLASQELLDAGIKTNNGLRDQRVALSWIQSYVSGFGGDPNNITVVGESVGAISCFLHLESDKPLFNRMLAMGGTPLLLKPVPITFASGIYDIAIERLGLAKSSTADQRTNALKEANIDALVAAAENIPMLPIIDGEFVKSPATFSEWSFQNTSMPGTKWCESIIMGDCEMDSSILFYMLHDRQARMEESFVKSASRFLKNTTTKERLLSEYDIGSQAPRAQDIAVDNILHFAHDIGFYAPLITIASGFPGKSYVFHFNERNPWKGRYQGVATHILDAAFLFQNYNEFLDESQRESAETFGKHFIKFVAGREPFPEYSAEKGGAMVYGAEGERQKFVTSKKSEDVQRRSTIFKLAELSSLEELSALWGSFLSGK